ncbi:glycoside hydrolase family 2 protein [Macrolepiota fuliginosa MF-IS2]|uniref:Beta-mannosidase A n=1 Tax=Macrolepiota fuliginosa MF-IS2 TaxID=1400762 RepID=A0A9P6C5X2_9AGAR|nr:glycoside hydrolase family 2 protein [Macrolepiota fuliginosa MF-IS2]
MGGRYPGIRTPHRTTDKMLRWWLSQLILPTLLARYAFADVVNTASLKWTLTNTNGTIKIPSTGPPNQAHLDLLNAGIITEPLLGINDFTQRWLVTEDWTYTADISPFLKSSAFQQSKKTLLVFYGIDTIANITLAGQPVAWVNNQFRQYVFDVTHLLASPKNTELVVALESAWTYGLNFEYPGVRQWVRKVASDFGWDWGPAFVPSGVHKPAYFVTLTSPNGKKQTIGTPPVSPDVNGINTPSPVFIEENSVDIYKLGQSFSVAPSEGADWVVNVTLGVQSSTDFQSPSLTLAFSELGVSKTFKVSTIRTSPPDGLNWINAVWRIPDSVPKRWFPHNLGNPQLYNLTVTLDLPSGKNAVDSVSFDTRTGFRTIQLVQSPYTQEDVQTRGITPGDNWHFNVNGKPFYALGTNIIPFDPFYARTTTDQVKWVIESAVKSGQNMLRVWGGGTYQPSHPSVAGGVYDFYSLCDEMGILAWSELIFSDSLYPINDFLLESIEPEVRQNVRRVNRHPSNAQWAGGNEIEGIITTAAQTLQNGTHYLDEYVALFQDFLQPIVTSETRSVPYTDCSTTTGVLSLDPYQLRLRNATPGDIYGNGERYNYDASVAFDYSTFPVIRFMNEFGFHSMPSFYTWEEVLTSSSDFSFNSTVVMSRDHHPPAGNLAFPNPNAPQGQGQMTMAVEDWLPRPVDSLSNPNQTFAQWCYSTQVFHNLAMVAQVAWYRHGAGKGENNLGALVWQLNDIWQGVSWSSVEFSGRWKVLQYGLAGVFLPVTIYPFWTAQNETLEVLAISDRWEAVGGSAQLTWYDWKGNTLSSAKHTFTVPSLNNSVILQQTGLQTILPDGHNATEVWMLLNLTAKVDGRTVTNEQWFVPTSLANAKLEDPQISITRTNDLTFTLSAKGGVAAWAWMDHPSGTMGIFVDVNTGLPANGFFLVPGIDRTLRFEMNPTLSRVKNPRPEDFAFRSLWNNTHI